MTTESSSEGAGCLDPSCRDCRVPFREIGIAIQPGLAGGFLFHAVERRGEDLSGSLDVVQAPTVDAALLEVFCRFAGDHAATERVHFVVDLPRGYPLWQSLADLHAALPRCHVQRPNAGHEALIAAARDGLPFEFTWGQYCPPPEDCGHVSATDLQPLTVATDGSVRGKFIGYGWLASDGQFNLHGSVYERRLVGSNPALVAELLAVDDAVRKLPKRPLTLMCDSSLAIWMIRKWMNAEGTLPEGYSNSSVRAFKGELASLLTARSRFYRNRERLTVVRVRGHQGEPLNEGADALARLASRYVMGSSELSPTQYRERAESLAKSFADAFRGVEN